MLSKKPDPHDRSNSRNLQSKGRSSNENSQHRKRKRGCRNWLNLPESIFSRLRPTFILDNCQFVCKTWLKICKTNPLVWQTIHLQRQPHDDYIYGNLEHMCRDLIDRSRGSLVDLKIVGFGSDRLLQHIADSGSCGIRRLRLEDCPEITDQGLCGVASNLQQLQELYISSRFLSCKTIEVIGRSCPHLVSLKLLKCRFDKGSKSILVNAIARTMPGLHRLWLSGFVPTGDEWNRRKSASHVLVLRH